MHFQHRCPPLPLDHGPLRGQSTGGCPSCPANRQKLGTRAAQRFCQGSQLHHIRNSKTMNRLLLWVGEICFIGNPLWKGAENRQIELTTLSAVCLVIVYHHESANKAKERDQGSLRLLCPYVVACDLPRYNGYLPDCSPSFVVFIRVRVCVCV